MSSYFTIVDDELEESDGFDAELDQEDQEKAEEIYFHVMRMPKDSKPEDVIARIKAVLQGEY